jgi:hypothetical protein
MSESDRGSIPPEELPPNERPASSTPPSPPPPPPPSPSPRDVSPRDEWRTEWRYRRHEWRRNGERSALSAMTWGAMLILAGLIFLANTLGLLPQWGGADAWSWIMLGAGVLLLLEAFLRAVLPDYGDPSWFNIVAGLVLIALGAGRVFALDLSLEQWWPVILIAIGLSTLLKGFRR